MKKPTFVIFSNTKLETKFESLEFGNFEERKLYDFIDKAIKVLKNESIAGTKIARRIWPKPYVQKYQISNLWKYDLPEGFRMTYTINVNDTMTVITILEWFNHKEYERRFKY